MNSRFCVHCGAPITTLSPQSPVLTCSACGKSFANPFLPKPSGGTSPMWLLAILAVPVGVAVIGILAAIAIPNFIRFRQRSQQVECKTTLKELAAAEASFFATNARYTSDLTELSLSRPVKSRYAIFLGPPPNGVRDVDPMYAPLAATDVSRFAQGEVPGADAEGFTALCAGQLDADETLDVWSLSNQDRVIAGTPVSANELWHHLDDLTDEGAPASARPTTPSSRKPKQ